MNTTEQIHQRDLERLKALRYIDDDFMTVCLADNYEGVETMCKMMEDMRNEAAQKAALDNAKETARRMIKKGKMSLEEIADYVPILSFDELKQLEAEVMQLV